MKKVAFVGNWWGTPKGHSYVVRDMVTALLSDKHEVHMFRCGLNEIGVEFPKLTSLESYNEKIIPKKEFEEWLDKINPDFCVFNEYQQWWDEDHNKLDICKEKGIKTIGYLVYERLNWDKINDYKKYWKIISPTGFMTKLLRTKGLYNAIHIKWGANLKEMDAVPNPPEKNKLIFYHCAGSGGVGNRKNTTTVIKAYKKIQDKNTELFITHLNSKIFTRREIIGFMKYADVLINTAKWETIGLNTLEANACGIPVIVADTQPMNELIKDNINGFTVKGAEVKNPYITCLSYEVDEDELSKKMEMCKNELILKTLKNNARKFAEMNFNWKENQKDFLKLFR